MTPDPILTDEELAEMEARCQAATPGPWFRRADRFVEAKCELSAGDIVSPVRSLIAQTRWTERNNPDNEAAYTALFIAHARTDVPRLIAALRALQTKVKEQEEHINLNCECRDHGGF